MSKTDAADITKPGDGMLQRSLTPLSAWALSLGCAVGWGAFMMPGNTFLPTAGPLGTVIGIVIGAVIMLIIGVNYSYMMRLYPDAGGALSYIKETFSHDHGFVGAWFLLLTYIAIVWANATALPLIGRFLLGNVFQFGFHYSVAGFDVYLGELLLSCSAIVLGGFLCSRGRVAFHVQLMMALLLCGGVLLCVTGVFLSLDGGLNFISPPFAPGKQPLASIFTIVAMGPWAFIGFESLSHATEEIAFPVKKAFPIMAVSVICGALIYSVLALIGASTLPEGFTCWSAYIAALDSLDISQGAPVFYAVRTALGGAGMPLLIISVLGGVLTGLIGNSIAASRLIYAMAKEGLLPKKYAAINKYGVPGNAVFLIVHISILIPFLGRTATGWIVDVTTVGSAIIYAYVSACALRTAKNENRRLITATGFIGLLFSLVFLLDYLVPNLLAVSAMGKESYLILAFWSAAGITVFRFLLQHDYTHNLGRSTVVWIVMLSLVLFTSLVWMRQSAMKTATDAIERVDTYYTRELADEHADRSVKEIRATKEFIQTQKDSMESTLTKNTFIETGFVGLSILMLFSIYTIIHKREKEVEREKVLAEEASRAKTSFLSHMSHEIRTPMNAIIGLDAIALQEPDLAPRTRDHLEKIGSSARHLLALINDILDMSRIESGRAVVKEEEFSFHEFLNQINVIINGQCQDKGLTYETRVLGDTKDYYIGDDMKLKQILINILGNAVKFTDAPGTVTFTTQQLSDNEAGCTLRFIIKDTGIGMSKEYIPKIFETFSQENAGTANRYGSTGLGMAITKNLVEMMKGDIHVESAKGVGSTFTVTVRLKPSAIVHTSEDEAVPSQDENTLEGLLVLIAEDIDLNVEILTTLLEIEGVTCDHAENGQKVLDLFTAHDPYHYDAILMDVHMPVMNGLEAAQAIRALKRPDAGTIPIIAMTADAFDEDVQTSLKAGMNAHLSKPIDPDRLYEELKRLAGHAR